MTLHTSIEDSVVDDGIQVHTTPLQGIEGVDGALEILLCSTIADDVDVFCNISGTVRTLFDFGARLVDHLADWKL